MEPSDDQPLPFWFESRKSGARPADIVAAEEYVGHDLPSEFRQLLAVKDGGVSNYSGYQGGGDFYPVLPIFGVDPCASEGTLLRAFDVRADFGVPDGVVPFAGLGDSWWGLDYRGADGSPRIVFRQDWEHDVEEVARSFADWLCGLVE